MTGRRAPRKLAVAGKRLWGDVAGGYALRVDEYRMLEDACREADIIERLEVDLSDAPLMVKGSMGQLVPSPLLTEVRQHRSTLTRMLIALKLPDQESKRSEAPQSTQARDAARQRWGRRVG